MRLTASANAAGEVQNVLTVDNAPVTADMLHSEAQTWHATFALDFRFSTRSRAQSRMQLYLFEKCQQEYEYGRKTQVAKI